MAGGEEDRPVETLMLDVVGRGHAEHALDLFLKFQEDERQMQERFNREWRILHEQFSEAYAREWAALMDYHQIVDGPQGEWRLDRKYLENNGIGLLYREQVPQQSPMSALIEKMRHRPPEN